MHPYDMSCTMIFILFYFPFIYFFNADRNPLIALTTTSLSQTTNG